MDFLTVPTLTGRVLFVLVLLLASPPEHRALRHHGSSDGHLVRSTSGRRISGRYGALLVAPRSRPELRRGVPAPPGWHGSRRSCLCAFGISAVHLSLPETPSAP